MSAAWRTANTNSVSIEVGNQQTASGLPASGTTTLQIPCDQVVNTVELIAIGNGGKTATQWATVTENPPPTTTTTAP